MSSFAQIADGRERWDPNQSIPYHRHDRAYVAVVLAGGYEECGSRGRFRVEPGDVLLHDAFDAHLNRFGRAGARLLNLVTGSHRFTFGRVRDPDAIARAEERDPAAARALFEEQIRPAVPVAEDWPDVLARDLLSDPNRHLDAWADEHGLAPETVSRRFSKVFGVTPISFRLEARSRRALHMVLHSAMPLAAVAAAAGFSDQAHMSRAIRALTGQPPNAWRRSNPFKTAEVGVS